MLWKKRKRVDNKSVTYYSDLSDLLFSIIRLAPFTAKKIRFASSYLPSSSASVLRASSMCVLFLTSFFLSRSACSCLSISASSASISGVSSATVSCFLDLTNFIKLGYTCRSNKDLGVWTTCNKCLVLVILVCVVIYMSCHGSTGNIL